jgi:hypothetical protein
VNRPKVFALGLTVLGLLLCSFDLSANSLFSLTGSYTISALWNGGIRGNSTSGTITGPSDAIIPDIIYDFSAPDGSQTAYARIFGAAATYDDIHCCYIEVRNSVSGLQTGDVATAYVLAQFNVTDTITPTSKDLPDGSYGRGCF